MSEEDPITIDQVEAIARRRLPANVYNYYSCGADDQTAVERNRTDFDRYSLGSFPLYNSNANKTKQTICSTPCPS
jgi:isopentenyl diphosphate isomerase/L-lactate dehydrogenase-like FMN-dependent dehydrogenase